MVKRKHISPIGDEGLYILDTASWRTVRPVMDKERCIECGMCLVYCPVNAIVGDREKYYRVTLEYCKGCGICAVECPKKAIEMVPEGGTQDGTFTEK